MHIFSGLSNIVQFDKKMNYKYPLLRWYAFILVGVLLFVSVLVRNRFFVSAFSGSGSGTAEAPYLISTCEHLQEIALDNDASYVLISDIDCSNTTSWNNGAGFAPIGAFTGSLDGRNHTITGLYINRPTDYAVGLFGFADGATIKNIRFANSVATEGQAAISGKQNVGVVAGELRYNAVFSNVHSELSVKSVPDTSIGSVGGLVGVNRGSISKSSSSGAVITDVPDSGGVEVNVGGLVGSMDMWDGGTGHIDDSYATGGVRLDNTDVIYAGLVKCGGLIGYMSYPSTVNNSYSKGAVNCPANAGSAGGLIGMIRTEFNPTLTEVHNNFTTSSVIGPWGARGFVGWIDSTAIDLSSNYYDKTQTGSTVCVYEKPTGCTGVNADGSTPDYFKNQDNLPFPSWDQTNIWTVGPNLPSLKEVQVSPDAPTDLSAVRQSGITLSWHTPVPEEGRSNNINDYNIEYKLASDSAWTVYDDGISTLTSVIVNGLADTSAYTFRIRAVNDIGTGLYSEILQVPVGVPDQVVGLTGEVNAKSAYLSWNIETQATKYLIQYKKITDTEWSMSTGSRETGDNHSTVYGLIPGSAYEFRVAASNADGQGPWSEAIELTTTQQQSYTISTCQELQAIQDDPSGNYTLAKDINCLGTSSWNDGKGFVPIDVFVGSLKGNGHSIDGLYMNVQLIGSAQDTFQGVGLFGVVIDANITNIKLQNSTVVASYALDEAVDENQDGVPDGVNLPTTPAEIQQLLAGGQQEMLADLGNVAGVIGSFGRAGAGSVAGVAMGGTYKDITSSNAAVIGGNAGGIFGIVTPTPVITQVEDGSTSDPESFNTNSDPIVMTRLSSSGAVNGVSSGGLVGLILSGVSNDPSVPQINIRDSSSTATVDGNLSGGLVGAAISVTEILSLMQTQNPAGIPEAVSTAMATHDIEVKNSISRGNVSTCNAITQVPLGSLGGILGIGVGVRIKDSKAFGNVTSCSSNVDEIGVYGGSLGGLAGSLLASRIDNSHASGRIGGEQPFSGSRPDQGLRIFAGSTGGLAGVYMSIGDQNRSPVINNNSFTGTIRNNGGNGLFAINGGLVGLYIGSGTIRDSYSKGTVENKLPQDHYFGASISGGLLGLSIGVDINPILSVVFGNGLIPSHGIVINNSYASGDIKTTNSGGGIFASISGGMGGLILGHASIINSHATGDISSNMPDGLHVNIGNPLQTQGNSVSISGGLFGFAAGIDQDQIMATVVGAEAEDGDGILIDNTYASGDVKGTIGGGLIGYAELRTRINKTYTEGKVRGTIVGGLVGASGAGTSAVGVGAGIALGSIADSSGIPAIALSFIEKGAEIISPLTIANTYSTGEITAVPLAIRVTDGTSPGPIAPFELPSMAGGIVGFYASPGGRVEDSYASGKITVSDNQYLEAGLSDQMIFPRIPSMAGGVFGLAIGVPQPDFGKILSGGNDGEEKPVDYFLHAPMVVRNVFAASELNIPDKTLVGGVAGLFGSPLSVAFQDSIPADKIYDIDNIYFDESQIKLRGCNGPRTPDTFFDKLYKELHVPGAADGQSTLPEDSPVSIVLPFFKSINCNSVNQSKANPTYFKNNKANPPLDKWDFNKTWVVRDDDYPKFVAGANTTNPTKTPEPTSIIVKASSPRFPSSGFGAGGAPAAKLDGLDNTGGLEKFLDKRLGSVSDRHAKIVPYILLLLLIALALLYTYMSILEDNRRKRLQALVTRFKASQAARSVYLKLTSHFVNTPITEMRTAVELLAGLKQLDPQVVEGVQRQLKILGGNAQMLLSTAQDLNQAQQASMLKVQAVKLPSIIKKPIVWVPIFTIVTLAVFANILFVQMDKYEPGVVNLATQIALAVLGMTALLVSGYFLEQSRHITVAVRKELDLEKSIIDQQTYLINSIAASLAREMQELKKYEKDIVAKPKGKIFANGLKDLEYLTSRFDKLSQLSKHVPGIVWSTNINLTAQKALTEVAQYAEQSQIDITSSVSDTIYADIDGDSLYHLLYSSLENAVKYSQPGSQVALTVVEERGYVVIEVEDHGKGISKENIIRLFQPFSRIDSVEQFDDQGIGMDLYFSKVIADNYAGSIVLVSREGQGTVAKIRLPRGQRPKNNRHS